MIRSLDAASLPELLCANTDNDKKLINTVSVASFVFILCDCKFKNQLEKQFRTVEICFNGWNCSAIDFYSSHHLLVISPNASMRLSRKKGHIRRTVSVRDKSISAIIFSFLSFEACASISPCGPAIKLLPQN